MSFSITEKRDIFQKVGTKDVKLHEYENGFINSNFCILWRAGYVLPEKLLMDLAKLVSDTEKKKELKERVRHG